DYYCQSNDSSLSVLF
nr:immunoglobulin light chain junction region [Macaca mulatta]MOX77932.1 immunoglobulin light chain junction region [Macaca mulatta]MOX78091.1 immunoglobulin light chain junction region [Macaca mulatta]MOX78489.1 immunoglobulin light chain junction region [Macaca mulatta]MOX78887.1 immunoglobulin light chain junction region [Macaca mulatta]